MTTPQLIFSFTILFLHLIFPFPLTDANCPVAPSCGPGTPPVRFPFRLRDTQSTRCGYPGFDLICNNQTQTLTLNIPNAGNFTVNDIDYELQAVHVGDPGLCLAQRFLQTFNLSASPFSPVFTVNFGFFNCSENIPLFSGTFQAMCLSRDNFTVLMTPTGFSSYATLSSLCQLIGNRSVPGPWTSWPGMGGSVQLIWNQPDCRSCEESGGACGFMSSSGLEIGCTNLPSNGPPRSIKYGLIIGVGIPGVLCLIGLGCYFGSKVKMYDQRRNTITELPNTIVSQRDVVICGLNKFTIDSYPKTLLGESKRLPEPNQNLCSICLSEYQPKEILKTIPECNHYFHIDCIDEWLRVKGTCPLCRNSPQQNFNELSPSTLSSSSSTSFSASS